MTYPNNTSIPNYKHLELTGANAFDQAGITSGGAFVPSNFTLTNGANLQATNTELVLPNLGAYSKQEPYISLTGGRWYQLRFEIRAAAWPPSPW